MIKADSMQHNRYALGIDVGGTNIKFALCSDTDFCSPVMSSFPQMSVPYIQSAPLPDYIASTALKFVKSFGLNMPSITAVGVALPGRVDYSAGHIMYACNLGLENVSVGSELSNRLGNASVIALNDADAAAYAEFKLGVLRGTRNSCLITLGTGVGAGFILDGKLFSGGKSRGTEFGHITLDIGSDEKCTCGKHGCAEALCSATYIQAKAKDAFPEQTAPTAEQVFELASLGDRSAISIIDKYVTNLSYAISSIIAMFDPEKIALGGGVSRAAEKLLNPLRLAVNGLCFFEEPGEIVCSQLQSIAGAVGAAAFAFDELTNSKSHLDS